MALSLPVHPAKNSALLAFKTARRKPRQLHRRAEVRSGLLRCGISTRL